MSVRTGLDRLPGSDLAKRRQGKKVGLLAHPASVNADLVHALDVLKGMRHVGSDKSLLRIPSDLPILITGGEDDAVGGDDGLGKLMLHYAQTLHQRLKIKMYKGGRHEMLFETNRDEVVSDLIEWLDAIAARHAA